jgi:hypothetical protein
MRRPFSLALLAVLVALAFVAFTHFVPRPRTSTKIASASVAADTVARLDSTQGAAPPPEADTMCLASRIGFPCDPR